MHVAKFCEHRHGHLLNSLQAKAMQKNGKNVELKLFYQ